MSDKPRMAKAFVAAGRTVVAATGEKRPGAYNADGKQTMVPVMQSFGPMSEIELPVDEIKQLRKSGHLIDPAFVPPPAAEGARVSEVGPVGLMQGGAAA